MPYSKIPLEDEYPLYFEQYIAKVSGSKDILAQLKKQQTMMLDLLSAIKEEKLNSAYAEGKWTIKELINHIVDTERIFTFRALSFARGEQGSLPGFNHDSYVQNSKAYLKSKMQLKEEYEATRNSTIALFRGFENSCVDKVGTANGLQMSVRAILYIVAGHEVHHLQVLRDKYL